jgi:hypothetical protein
MLDMTSISHRFNPIADAMRAITRVGLAGVGGLMNPGFVFRAATHGQIAALITSPRWAVPYWDMATKAAPEMFRGMMGKATPALDEAIRQGAVEARNSMDKDFIESGVYDQDLRSYWEKTGYGKMMWNALKSPFDLYNHFGHAVHRMANLGYFMRHNDGAANPLKLGMETQQVYLDRAEPFMGSFVNWWAERTMFMSIGFKESAQFAKAMQARPFTTMAMGMSAMFLPQMAITMANLLQDEFLPEGERYMDFTQEQRDHMTILPRMPGGWRPQLPKPYYLNAIFQAPAERFVLGMMGKSPNSWKQDFKEILTLMLPPMVANALLPGIEQATNRNLTTGQPIITDRQSPMSADRRFGPNTTVVAKKLTDILGDPAGGGGLGIPKQVINPRALDNFMDRWLSNVGVQVVAAVGGRMDPQVHAYDVGGPNGWTHYPILSTFFTTAKDGGIPRDLLDNLWDEVQKFQTAKADASSYKQEAHQEGTDNETPDTIRGMSKFKIQRYTKQLAGFQNAISGIEHNDEMTDVEKHKEMAGIMPGIIAQAEAMKKALDEAEAGYKARTSGQ